AADEKAGRRLQPLVVGKLDRRAEQRQPGRASFDGGLERVVAQRSAERLAQRVADVIALARAVVTEQEHQIARAGLVSRDVLEHAPGDRVQFIGAWRLQVRNYNE